jgi:hypothetical protein
MTILFDPVCHGQEHAPFTAALLATTRRAFPGEGPTFFGEASHIDAVRALLDPALASEVTWKPIAVVPRACADLRARLTHEWRAISTVLREASRRRCTRIVACATTESGLAALKARLALTFAPIHVAVVHHSGLASLLGSRTTRALLRWGNGSRLHHVVLGPSIRDTVVARQPSLAPSLDAVRHPYLLPEVEPSVWPEGGPVRFGFLGVASRDKGFDAFCRLAARVAGQSTNGASRPRFELVGRLGAEHREGPSTGSGTAGEDDRAAVDISEMPMPRPVYEDRVARLTYAVLPYAPAHYAVVSSGAILDAFAYGKPCIALRNPLFEEYFSAMGDIGHLCDTEQQLFEVVSGIVQSKPRDQYAAQSRRILAARRIFSPEDVAGTLRRILERP